MPKPGPAIAEPSTKTIITRQTVPLDAPRERTTPEFWTYVEALVPEDWDEHSVYIYRTDPRSSTYGEGNSALEKVVGQIEVKPGQFVPFNNREDVELAIKEKWGGRAFRLILKRRSERVTEGKIVNDAGPKYPDQQNQNQIPGGPMIAPMTEAGSAADVAKTAMSTIANQDRAAIEVAMSALRGSADIVSRLAAAPAAPIAAAPTETDQLMRQAMVALLNKALNPPDPLELLTRILPLIAHGNGNGNGNGTPAHGSAMDRLLDVAVERILNPQPSGPAVSAAAELVRQLPGVAGYVTQAMSEWRHGAEAQRDAAAIMRGQPIPAAPGAAPQPGAGAPLAPRVLPPPAAAAPVAERNDVGISIEFVESKIVEIMRRPNLSAEEAADDCLSFLDVLDPALVRQLASLGEIGLTNLFQTRPTLRQMATQNMPRVTDFIKAFLRFATSPDQTAPTPAASTLKQ